MRWRPIQNEWNLKSQPWSGATGIEEDDETAVVPALICWFTRGCDDPEARVKEVCDLHNIAPEIIKLMEQANDLIKDPPKC